jgi:hypothetical protein
MADDEIVGAVAAGVIVAEPAPVAAAAGSVGCPHPIRAVAVSSLLRDS